MRPWPSDEAKDSNQRWNSMNSLAKRTKPAGRRRADEHVDPRSSTVVANSKASTASSQLGAALEDLRHKWYSVPIPSGTKKPTIERWPNLRLDEQGLREHFSGPMNRGLLLGSPSGGLVDVDLDSQEAIQLAPEFLPATERRHGRAGKPESHRWYLATPVKVKTTQFADVDGKMIVELRGDGHQTVVPPSVHETSERLCWHAAGEPAAVDLKDLQTAVSRLATAVLVALHWPAPSDRQQAALALAGTLLQGGLTIDAAEHFLRAVAMATGDEAVEARVGAVRARTAEEAAVRMADHRRLAKLVGVKVCNRLARWLDLGTTPAWAPPTTTNGCPGSQNSPATQGAPEAPARRGGLSDHCRRKKLTIAEVLEKLGVQQCSENENQWSVLCPAHHDTRPSLSVTLKDDGKLMLCCHAGCDTKEVVAAAGLEMSNLFAGVAASSPGRRRAQAKHKVSRPASQPARGPEPAPEKARSSAPPKTSAIPNPLKLVTAKSASEDWAARATAYKDDLDSSQLKRLAKNLGLAENSLLAIHIGWCTAKWQEGLYTFPEFNAKGKVIGISTRAMDGTKKVMPGSNRGLYLPMGWYKRPGPILVPEGATDTAALTTMGLAAVGRPSAKVGVKLLAQLLAALPADREIIILGEMDAKPDGSWTGRDAARAVAEQLASQLRRDVKHALPPPGAKDVRAWLQM